MVVEVKIGNKEVRIISGYGPQENWPAAARMPFFMALEEEVVKAELANKSIIIELDANSKLGPAIIPGDKHQQSENGRVLAGIIHRHSLVIGNSMKQCEGLITRRRVTKDKTEESTIDFILFSGDIVNHVEKIVIDENREHVLTKLAKTKNGVKKVESDHNSIISTLKLQWAKNQNIHKRVEMYNLKNTTCQELFKIETSKDVNKGALSSVFDEEGDLNTLTKKFMKRLEGTIKRCFKKIRIKKRTDEIKESLFKKWKSLKNKDDQKSKKELEDVEKELTDRYAKEYFDKIKERTGHATEDGKVNVASLWNLKKELFPQSRDPPTAMKDPRNGNLLSTEDKIQDAAVYSYTKRLENKPMKDNLKHIKDAKELLCDKIIKAAQTNITPPWEMKHLEKVLKYLKKNKSRDPL